jgi:hypothetical protein
MDFAALSLLIVDPFEKEIGGDPLAGDSHPTL